MYNFIIDKNTGDDSSEFKTESGLLIAVGYNKIVIGKRGPYIEFNKNLIKFDNIYVPKNEQWRINSNCCFYNEYRSKDECYIKIYEQKETVAYAEYKIGMFYVSPELLYINNKRILNDEALTLIL